MCVHVYICKRTLHYSAKTTVRSAESSISTRGIRVSQIALCYSIAVSAEPCYFPSVLRNENSATRYCLLHHPFPRAINPSRFSRSTKSKTAFELFLSSFFHVEINHPDGRKFRLVQIQIRMRAQGREEKSINQYCTFSIYRCWSFIWDIVC